MVRKTPSYLDILQWWVIIWCRFYSGGHIWPNRKCVGSRMDDAPWLVLFLCPVLLNLPTQLFLRSPNHLVNHFPILDQYECWHCIHCVFPSHRLFFFLKKKHLFKPRYYNHGGTIVGKTRRKQEHRERERERERGIPPIRPHQSWWTPHPCIWQRTLWRLAQWIDMVHTMLPWSQSPTSAPEK